jgi:hypothetical protein
MTATYPESWTPEMYDDYWSSHTAKSTTDEGNGKILIRPSSNPFASFDRNGKKPKLRKKNNRKLEKQRRKQGRR